MTNIYSAFPKVCKYYLSVTASPVFGLSLILVLLTACSSTPQYSNKLKQNHSSTSAAINLDSGSVARKGGGYYLDDGPGDNPPPNLHLVPDAVPKVEPLRLANMQPYVALGKYFRPMTEL